MLSVILKKRYRQIFIGFVMLSVVLICAIAAPLIASHDPDDLDVPQRLKSPSVEHIFGTDQYGRDVFSRVVFGARLTIIVGTSVVLLTGFAGVFFGLAAGYFHKVETIIMRIMDGLQAFPAILLALVVVAALGPGLINIILALSISYTPAVVRLVRGTVLVVKQYDHVEAARASGAGHLRIILFHILPLCWSPIIVYLSLIMAYTAIAEASLSFLGVGLPPEFPSFGNILGEGRAYMKKAPWLTFIPGLAIMLSVLSLNILGDGLRDLLDPRLKNV